MLCGCSALKHTPRACSHGARCCAKVRPARRKLLVFTPSPPAFICAHAMSDARPPYDEEEAHDSDEEEETDDSATDESDSFDDEQSWCATRSSTRVPFPQNAVCLTCSLPRLVQDLLVLCAAGERVLLRSGPRLYTRRLQLVGSRSTGTWSACGSTRGCVPAGGSSSVAGSSLGCSRGFSNCCSPTPRRLSSDRASLPATPSMYLPCPRSRCRPGTTTTR